MEDNPDNINPTIQQVRDWGYNLDLNLTDQDEDLILYSVEYVAILMEMASDEDCPKNYYCLSILRNFSQELLAKRDLYSVKKIGQEIERYAHTPANAVSKWIEEFLNLKNILQYPLEITEHEADSIARSLMRDDSFSGTLKKLRTMESGFIEYEKISSYASYFYINPCNSYWKLSRFFRLKDEEIIL